MACANKDRYRSKIVNFRMTIEEAEELNAKVALSGLPKQKYLADCVLNHKVRIVCGKKAVRAMQMYLEAILEELQFLEENQNVDESLIKRLEVIISWIESSDDYNT